LTSALPLEQVVSILTLVIEVMEDILNTMISRISTIKPKTPPLVPNFHVLPWPVAVSISSAMTSEKRERCRSMLIIV
jgi:hypothetical protein